MSKGFSRLGWMALFTFPLWGVLALLRDASFHELPALTSVLKFSFLQAFASALGAFILGIPVGVSLLNDKTQFNRMIRWVLFAFAGLPALFWISAVFWWSYQFQWVPRGYLPIVICHSFMNFALVALGFERASRFTLGSYLDVALTMGMRRGPFWKNIALPLLAKDLALLFLVVFGFCFASLSAPLVFSTPDLATLEVYISRLGLREGRWNEALVLGGAQWIALATVLFFLPQRDLKIKASSNQWGEVAGKLGLLLVVVPVLFLSLSLMNLFLEFLRIEFWQSFWMHFSWIAVFGTISVGGMATLFTLLTCWGLFLMGPDAFLRKFLLGYLSPSMALAALVMFLLPGNHWAWDLVKVGGALALLLFPALYRWTFDSHWRSLDRLWVQGEVLGGSPHWITKNIMVPNSLQTLCWMAGVAGIWAVTDFALPSLILQRPLSLAMASQAAFMSYQISIGQAYMLLCLLFGLAFLLVLKLLLRENPNV
ncbi:MAG: hypothetical protein KDD22_03940 [Bdellovibrionales bacterium]|nr:hypothetical protein [Bdellovibrionales bacterium]